MSSSLPPTSTSAVPDSLRSLVVPPPGTTTLPSLAIPCPLGRVPAAESLRPSPCGRVPAAESLRPSP
ncbi:hypothetical protein TeGR_g14513 [Tetraparma gracilis]|uniref:Uncharacterized protein n=1 Tax=Tetraparma gracilis TaxID=2962635 RepID=A0ABQ6NCU7_9STRA|nr:hypothetical protein TeGR_g14513 [Tetraparma gracilis]